MPPLLLRLSLIDGNVLGSGFYLGRFLGDGQAQQAIGESGVDIFLAQFLTHKEGPLAAAGVALSVKIGAFGLLTAGVLGGHGQVAIL